MLAPVKKLAIRKLAVADFITAAVAWMAFWVYRHEMPGKASFFDSLRLLLPRDYFLGLLIPAGWVFLYLLSGTYFDLYRKSRLNEINRTLISCILGSIFIALFIFANDADEYSYFIR